VSRISARIFRDTGCSYLQKSLLEKQEEAVDNINGGCG
jgi:hypothetical protein